jgi:hypothetical protein
MNSSEFIHYGCGTTVAPSWRNFDAGPAFWLQLHFRPIKALLVRKGYPDYPPGIEYGDIIKGLPIVHGSASCIYCSHVLEHLTLQDFRIAIRNTFLYLRPGGTFRLVLPDLQALANKYLERADAQAAGTFMRESFLGRETRQDGIKGLLRTMFGRSEHLWMWDYQSISAELKGAGFVEIRRAQFHDNPLPQFLEVESEWRWTDCLGVECKRPFSL